MASRPRNPRTVLIVGTVFIVMSAGTALWRRSQGQPFDVELGLLFGGLVVAAFGLYLYVRDSRSTESPNEP